MNIFEIHYFILLIFGLLTGLSACTEKSVDPIPEKPIDIVIDTPNEVPDLPFAAWTPKTVTLPASFEEVPASTGLKAVDVNINFSKRISKVSRYVTGNNANCFSGWMQNNALLMKNINNLMLLFS